MKVVYFVQDLNDPAVARRVRMMRIGGISDISLIGFWRAKPPPNVIAEATVTSLGKTSDRALRSRALSVFVALFKIKPSMFADANVLIGRGVEMLAIAKSAKRRFAPSAALVYECLDIHRIMYSETIMGSGVRAAEKSLMRQCDLLMISSPAYVREFFQPRYGFSPPVCIVENKVLESEFVPDLTGQTAPLLNAPWRIGWFGRLRCQKSLHLLQALAIKFPGKVEIVIRGRPDLTLIPDFNTVVAETKGMFFHGPYDRSTELQTIYRDVHFAWMLDFYESNYHGKWCLVNRMYEAGSYGCVLIGQRSTEGGRWLADRNVGVLVDEPLFESLIETFANMNLVTYGVAHCKMRQLPMSNFIYGEDACAEIAHSLSDAVTRSRGQKVASISD